jgi:UDP-N-acetylglucosamine--dolichyl-phosphate N-acetylglucosaminephosphotransferase
MHPQGYLRVVAGLSFLPSLLAFVSIQDDRTRYSILISAFVSCLGFFATVKIIPVIQARTLRAGLFGRDLNKSGTEAGEKKIPESLGLASGLVFLV